MDNNEQSHLIVPPQERHFLTREECDAFYMHSISPFYDHWYEVDAVLDLDGKTARALRRKYRFPIVLGTRDEVPPGMMQQILAQMLRHGPKLLPHS